ncbi:isochorismatase family protein [Nocardioides sp.]|uniref:isochorismatase family protein n=1 Tax=Nocardioides sp. TaxID=35761 RepID=UPI003D15018F
MDATPALVVIDLQKGLQSVEGKPHTVAEVVSRTAELATAFRDRDFPVVLVNVAGGPPGRTEPRPPAAAPSGATAPAAPPANPAELIDELGAQESDHRITKKQWGAFHNTELHGLLQDLGVTQVFVAGIATSAGVESTARSAHDLGYNVVVATDAMTDRDPAVHANSVERIFPKLAETATAAEILDKLSE